jgi:16S rRNA (uracil1498-N3)-methyltransferase
MRRRFFVDKFENESATVRGDTANHLARVLRAEPGQLYELSDGATLWLARIDEVGLISRGENRVEFSLVEQLEAPKPGPHVTLLLSLVKFDRFEWALEKATELGVTEIVPLAAERTDKPLVAAAEKRHDRWVKILHESAQQSRRLAPPKLAAEAIRPAKAFAAAHGGLKLMLSERHDAPSLRVILGKPPHNHEPTSQATLAIGPEGGWTDAELESARAAHFAEASLGDLVLRTETAVVAALAVVTFSLNAK